MLHFPQDHAVQPPQLCPHAALRQRGIPDAVAVRVIKAFNGVFKYQCRFRWEVGKLAGIQNIQKVLFSFLVRQSVARVRGTRQTDFDLTTIYFPFFFLTWRPILRFCSLNLCGSAIAHFTALGTQILRFLRGHTIPSPIKRRRISGS